MDILSHVEINECLGRVIVSNVRSLHYLNQYLFIQVLFRQPYVYRRIKVLQQKMTY